MAELKEQIFLAIDTIIQVRLNKLQYNLTITAILNSEANSDGSYTVTYQGMTMPVIAGCPMPTTDELSDQTYVAYVLIPNGDYTNDKIILAVKKLTSS